MLHQLINISVKKFVCCRTHSPTGRDQKNLKGPSLLATNAGCSSSKKSPSNQIHHYLKILTISALLLVLGTGFALAKSTTFNGGANNTSWTDPGNWTNGLPTVGDNVTINAVAVIGTNDYVEIGSLNIGSSGDLTVNGTLVVDGNMTMDNNGSVFSMGSSSVVIINGYAQLANKIDFSLSSYFIVKGDFTKLGSNSKGSLSINNAHIYLLGNVSLPSGGTGPWDYFTSCNGSYSGTTSSLTSSVCAYGDAQDYANNISSFPQEIINMLNCGGLSLSVNATANPTTVYSGSYTQLKADGFTPSTVTLLDEGFNSATNNWTLTGTNNSGEWTLRPKGYSYQDSWYGNLYYFHSNDNSQFYLANSDSYSSGPTKTYIESPSINTQGLSSLNLEFHQYFKYYGYETASVEVSTDGTNWTSVKTFNKSIGSSDSFSLETVSLNSYVGFSTLFIRFKYDAYYDWWWAIDNVKVTGTPAIQYSWTSSPAGFTATTQNTAANPTQTTTYTVQATDLYHSCTKSASVTVNVTPDTEAPVFPDFPNDTTVTADPATCTANVWYNIPAATDNAGGYAGPLTGFGFLGTAPFNGHSYYMSNDLKLSIDAHKNVFDNGGHLATITSQAENDFLSPFAAAKDTDVWFGLTDAAQEGTFRWVTGEYYSATDPASYKNWNAGEPNNSNNNEDWAEMYGTNPSLNGKWNDQFNTDSRYFFLEFDGPRVTGEMQNEGDPTWYPAPAPGSAFSTGIHHMRFTATDGAGNTTVRTFDIIVNSGLNLAFSNPDQLVCANETGVTYTLNQTLDSYVWDVTGGTISAGGGTTDNYVTVDWGSGPDGKVTATGANTGGCSETVSTNVHIIQPVAYTPSPDTTICDGATAHLRVTLPVDSAMQFDGSSYIAIPDDNSINLQAVSNRTVSLWFKADDVSPRQVLYEEGGGVNGFSIYIESGSVYVHGWEGGNTWTTTPISASISANQWYNIAFVYDAAASDGIYFKGYLNGSYIGGASPDAAKDNMSAHSGNINIGYSDGGGIVYPDGNKYAGDNFKGEIDEFKLWNSSLSESEIFSEQYNNTYTSNEIVHYSFNNDNGTTVVDETGGNDGTLNGTVHTTDAPFWPTVSWSPGGGAGTTNDVSPTANTTYTYTLTEPLLGCTTSGSIAVTVNKVSLNASVTDETCAGSANGAINLTPSGGVTPYSYAWSTADGSGLNASSEDQTGLAPGTYDVVVTDANGCSATGSYTVATVPDVTNPTITAPSDINQVADNGVCTAAVSIPNPTTYDDNCTVASLLWEMTGATVDNSAGSGINSVGTYTFNKGTTTITWTVTDAAGNSAQASMNVTVTDDQNPTITAPADVSVYFDPGSCLATGVSLGTPTTDDNCGVPSVTNNAPVSFPEGTTTVTWTVTDNSGNTATATQKVTVTGFISSDDPSTEGTDSWIGHIYDGTNFQDYYGYTSEPQEFDEDFGGSTNCYDFDNSLGAGKASINTTTFSVHYQMHSTLNGIYLVDIGSDDGARLYVDGNAVYDHWSNRAYATDAGILFSVNGDNHLLLDFYENTGANRISFNNLRKVDNTLTSGTTQNICINSIPAAIVGSDAFADSPISSNAGYTVTYQWQESTDGSTFTDISGATAKDYSPPAGSAGTIYYRRVLVVTHTNPGSIAMTATSTSGVASVTFEDNVAPAFDTAFTYGNLTECATDELSQQATLTLDLPVANTDNCGTPTLSYSVTGKTTVSSTVVTGSTVNVTFNEGVSTVTYTLDDGNGKTSTLSFTVTVEHKPNPGDITAN